MTIEIARNEAGANESFAQICAELVRQGIKFKAVAGVSDFVITLTGGY